VGWIQDALDCLDTVGEIEISVNSVGHRSAFVGAVLCELPETQVIPEASPPRIKVRRSG